MTRTTTDISEDEFSTYEVEGIPLDQHLKQNPDRWTISYRQGGMIFRLFALTIPYALTVTGLEYLSGQEIWDLTDTGFIIGVVATLISMYLSPSNVHTFLILDRHTTLQRIHTLWNAIKSFFVRGAS